MNKTLEESRCLASLAVFRELYNLEKDIYSIISEFLSELIVSTSKHSFNLTEITSELNITYDFSIPEAVIKTSLNRLPFLSKSNGIYSVENLAEIKSKQINNKKDSIQESNEKIIGNLFKFIESQDNKTLSEVDKKEIVHSLISFLIDSANGNNYSEYISAFILSNQDDEYFKKRLNTIKEGVVLYSGIKFNNNINELGQWKSDLTIFIETEILFHFAGYNGVLYQTLWNDFFEYVKEINRKHPNRIKLKYFGDVKGEIERFFKKAEYIIEGKDKPNPKITAMNTILNGCDSPADIVSKKAQFFQNLKTCGIQEDDFKDYFNEANYQYNIVDQKILDNISKELEIEDVSDYLRFLNYVSIRRKEANENNFENIGYILLSGNSKTLQIAWNENIKVYGQVPLATTLSFLTNKFWFKLNKGFGKDNFPTTFDVVTKAQIVLSNQINESVGRKYDDLQLKFKNGQLTQDQAKASIIELRKQSKKPEEIRDEDISSILDSISEDSLESFLKEQEHFKSEAKKEALENKKLKEDLTIKEIELKQFEQVKINLNDKLIETKENLLSEKEKSIQILENQKKPIKIEIKKSISIFKIKIASILIISYLLTYFLLWKYGWDNSEQWTWVFSFTIPLLISLLYMLFKEKTLNPLELLEKQKTKIKNKKYNQFNFDSNHLKKLKTESEELKTEIKELKASTQQWL
tara:strand:- start:26 stop:2107 length:2082 start_codon:yes stop_codon:yes gene_type:complete